MILHNRPSQSAWSDFDLGSRSQALLGNACQKLQVILGNERIKHIKEARSSIPTDFQSVRRPYILTVDRNKPGNRVADNRGRQSIRRYLRNGGTPATSEQDLDEYPPKVFLENRGRAHVKPIEFRDNRRAGNDIRLYITGLPGTTQANALYKDGDQVEIVVPNFYGLFCRDAF